MNFADLFSKLAEVWNLGGWAIYPLAVNALILYTKAAEIHLTLIGKGYNIKISKRLERLRKLKESGRQHRDNDLPVNEYGVARQYLRDRGVRVTKAQTIEQIQSLFDEMRAAEIPPINRDLKFMRFAMATAPLLGLLGTVTGMFNTFDGLAQGAGGGKTIDAVASGISQALITTQTGLTIALPAYFLNYVLTRGRDKYAAFITHLEIVCTTYMRRAQSISTGKMSETTAEAMRRGDDDDDLLSLQEARQQFQREAQQSAPKDDAVIK